MSRHKANDSVAVTGVDRLPRSAQSVSQVLHAWPRLWLLVAGVVAAFLILGGDSLSSSSRAVLHGLCAQRPTHSFAIGEDLLPFDARMTGIYTGALWAWGITIVRRRLLSADTPPWAVVAVLAGAVGALAADGFNSLFLDLGLWHPWEPHNAVRFFTGFGTGVALVSLEVWLIGGAVWRVAKQEPVWDRVRELWWVPIAALVTFGIVRAEISWTYAPIVAVLLTSAWITVTGLMFVILVSGFRLDRRVRALGSFEAPLIISAVVALVAILALAQLRFWMERSLGIPQDFEPVAVVHLRSILGGV